MQPLSPSHGDVACTAGAGLQRAWWRGSGVGGGEVERGGEVEGGVVKWRGW